MRVSLPAYLFDGALNLKSSTIDRDDLVSWLSGRGVRTGFFFLERDPNTNSATPDYLDPNNKSYSPKLAAAVYAWQAVTAAPPMKMSVKQALAKWLRENASRFDMTNGDGNVIEATVEDISKVANWEPYSGAPKTSREVAPFVWTELSSS